MVLYMIAVGCMISVRKCTDPCHAICISSVRSYHILFSNITCPDIQCIISFCKHHRRKSDCDPRTTKRFWYPKLCSLVTCCELYLQLMKLKHDPGDIAEM
eukprot:253441_1